jgi:hypothetical protein
VTRGFMGPLGGFWPKLGRKRVTGWKQRSCVPPGRVKTNKQNLAENVLVYARTKTFSAKTETLTAKTEKFSAKTESFFVNLSEF